MTISLYDHRSEIGLRTSKLCSRCHTLSDWPYPPVRVDILLRKMPICCFVESCMVLHRGCPTRPETRREDPGGLVQFLRGLFSFLARILLLSGKLELTDSRWTRSCMIKSAVNSTTHVYSLFTVCWHMIKHLVNPRSPNITHFDS